MKFKTTLLSILFAVGCTGTLSADPLDRIEDVYDLFSPSGSVNRIYVHVYGDGENERVSLRAGKNPLVIKDEKGKVMEPDPKYKTEYIRLVNTGAEDNRSFHLEGSHAVSKDEWKKLIFSFTPRRDGRVTIKFGNQGDYWWDYSTVPRIPSKYPNLHYTFYANAEAKNTQLRDPKFTSVRTWRTTAFIKPFRAETKAETVSEQGAPTPRVLKSIGHMSQVINVKKDKEVVISFYVRGGDCFKSKLLSTAN